MKKFLRILLSVLLILAALFGILTAVSHFVWHRSAMATLVEQYLYVTNTGFHDTAEQAEAYMKERAEVEDDPFVLPDKNYKSTVTMPEDRLIVFSGSEETDNTVIFLHGGSYINEITGYHLSFCDRLASEANATVYVPVYPLAPNHTWEETYPLVQRIYIDEKSKCRPVTLMGDSAGGGLAAAFCEDLTVKGWSQPDHLILLSPWVDVSMTSSDYTPYLDTDPMLGVEGLAACGSAWAGSLDPKDYRVSPMFGDVSGLPETTIFTGTREIFYPDLMKFQEKLRAAGVDSTLIVAEGMNHDFPLFPIPEAADVRSTMVEIIRSGI